MTLTLALLAMCAGLNGATPVRATTDTVPGTISGTVTDSAGHAVTSASVQLDSEEWKPTSASGHFEIRNVTPGRHLLAIRSPGYAVDSLYVHVDPGDAISLTATLQRVTTLAAVDVRAKPDTARPPVHVLDWTEGFERRRTHNVGGVFLDQAAIRRKGATRMTELLRGVPGVDVHPVYNQFGTFDYVVIMRGVSVVDSKTCPIQYYLDGHPFSLGDDIDRTLSPHQIAAMEIYPGGSQVPEQFKSSMSARCGVIVIWTRSDAR
jgi:hypothetical protein